MKQYSNAKDFAEASGVPFGNLQTTFTQHTQLAEGGNEDPFGKCTSALQHLSTSLNTHSIPLCVVAIFHNAIYSVDQPIHVAIITPVVHYVRLFPCPGHSPDHLFGFDRQWAV